MKFAWTLYPVEKYEPYNKLYRINLVCLVCTRKHQPQVLAVQTSLKQLVSYCQDLMGWWLDK